MNPADTKAIDEDLNAFLSKVDKIDELVKDLATSDDHVSSAGALKKADKYLSSEEGGVRTAHDRTLVNTPTTTTSDKSNHHTPPPSEEGGVSVGGGSEMAQDEFLRSVEEDARERAERRKERESRGKAAKKKGNEMFKQGHFDNAVQLFTEAIKETPWDLTLYTNRALTYNRLRRYDRAIEDCDTALRFELSTLKAYVHKGNALKGLKEIAKARECFQKALELFPDSSKQLNNYLKELQPPSSADTSPADKSENCI